MFVNQKAITAVVLLAVTAVFSLASMASDNNSSRATPSKFVGVFYLDSNVITTYHSGGTSSTIGAHMFSDDPNGARLGRRETPRQGVWRKVGENKIQVTQLAFLTGEGSHDYSPDGVIEKISWLAVFDEPVNGVSPGYTATNVVLEIFLPDQNPTTDDPVVVFEGGGSRAYRLEVE